MITLWETIATWAAWFWGALDVSMSPVASMTFQKFFTAMLFIDIILDVFPGDSASPGRSSSPAGGVDAQGRYNPYHGQEYKPPWWRQRRYQP